MFHRSLFPYFSFGLNKVLALQTCPSSGTLWDSNPLFQTTWNQKKFLRSLSHLLLYLSLVNSSFSNYYMQGESIRIFLLSWEGLITLWNLVCSGFFFINSLMGYLKICDCIVHVAYFFWHSETMVSYNFLYLTGSRSFCVFYLFIDF